MPTLKSVSRVMDNTTAYRLWQAPFLHQKFEPILRHNNLDDVRRVLDVGCGPGTNCPYFEGMDYLGVDINPEYIEYARKKFARNFEVADVTQYRVPDEQKFDFVLLNSLLHHIDDTGANHLLSELKNVLSPDGHVHIVDLVLPQDRGIPQFLAKNDRGDFGRPRERWQEFFETHFHTEVFEVFDVSMLGVKLWNLVYFKGQVNR